MSQTIAIAGLGWLGLPLAQHLKLLGFRVKGSVTSLEKAGQLQKSGWEAYPITLTENGIKGPVSALLTDVDILVISIPPGLRRNSGADHVLKMAYLLEAVQKAGVKKVILISSTSVYGDQQGKVTEKVIPLPENEAGRQLLQVEQMFFNASGLKATILRFGGLFGGSRQPVRYLAGRTELSGGNAAVNLIHRDDCIGIISQIIRQDAFGHIFNGVMPDHPKKADYYRARAEELGLTPPEFSDPNTEAETYKQIDSDHIEATLNYEFRHSL